MNKVVVIRNKTGTGGPLLKFPHPIAKFSMVPF